MTDAEAEQVGLPNTGGSSGVTYHWRIKWGYLIPPTRLSQMAKYVFGSDLPQNLLLFYLTVFFFGWLWSFCAL